MEDIGMKRLLHFMYMFFLLFTFVGFILASVAYGNSMSDDLLGLQPYDSYARRNGAYIGMRIVSMTPRATVDVSLDFLSYKDSGRKTERVAHKLSGMVSGPNLSENDIIIEIEGSGFKSMDEFLDALKSHSQLDSYNIKLLRGEEEITTTIRHGDMENWEIKGIATPLGVAVRKIDIGSPAYKAGIKKQDQIIKLNQKYVINNDYLENILAGTKPNDILSLEIIRDNERINTEIRLDNPEIEITEVKIHNAKVNIGDKIPLISITATGNLDIDGSFLWFREGQINNKQISLKKHNSTIGMTVENDYNEETDEYTTTLWADAIKQEADGIYYCQISDRFRSTIESAEITISIS